MLYAVLNCLAVTQPVYNKQSNSPRSRNCTSYLQNAWKMSLCKFIWIFFIELTLPSLYRYFVHNNYNNYLEVSLLRHVSVRCIFAEQKELTITTVKEHTHTHTHTHAANIGLKHQHASKRLQAERSPVRLWYVRVENYEVRSENRTVCFGGRDRCCQDGRCKSRQPASILNKR
jgi:hypothetical protein